MQVWRRYESTAAWALGCAVLALLGRLLAHEAGWRQSALWLLVGGLAGLAFGVLLKRMATRENDG
jgi:hypothetical protein